MFGRQKNTFLGLQAEIVLIVFFKIQSLGLAGDTLAGIIPEFAARMLCRNDSSLFAHDLGIVYDRTAGAVGAGTGVLLAK